MENEKVSERNGTYKDSATAKRFSSTLDYAVRHNPGAIFPTTEWILLPFRELVKPARHRLSSAKANEFGLEISPTCGVRGPYANHRAFVDGHPAILGILAAEEKNGFVVP